MPDVINLEKASFVIPIRPQGKPRMTKRDKWKKRQAVIDWYAYVDRVKEEFEVHWYEHLNKATIYDFRVIATFTFPKSYSKKKQRELMGKRHRVKPDASNILKGIEDILVEQDQALADVHCHKRWGEEDSIAIHVQYLDED